MHKHKKDFFARFRTLQEEELPFVVYRLPQGNELIVAYQKTAETTYTNTLNEEGFVFAPFEHVNEHIYIPSNKSESFDIPPQTVRITPARSATSEQEKATYTELVSQAKETIAKTSLQKVVVSRKQGGLCQEAIVESFVRLVHTYPNAMVYYWSHQETGNWIGATPETLLDIQEGTCKTMALAGTLPYQKNTSPTWSAKERSEQMLVSDFIQNRLQTLLPKSEVSKSEVQNKRAGNLVHLCTHFEFPLESLTPLQITKLLHPTPAVAGVPVEDSIVFINENETHQRKYYTGFMGPIGSNTLKLFVNLRCAQVQDRNLTLYIGGGITAESDVEKEWHESQRKTETLLNVL